MKPMNSSKNSLILTGVALATLVTAHAWAGNCTTSIRPFPPSGPAQDGITMECRHNNAANTVGAAFVIVNGDKEVGANLASGAVVETAGLDINGTITANCLVQDGTPGSSARKKTCNGGVRWFGVIAHAE
jgi:hypothetical protein